MWGMLDATRPGTVQWDSIAAHFAAHQHTHRLHSIALPCLERLDQGRLVAKGLHENLPRLDVLYNRRDQPLGIPLELGEGQGARRGTWADSAGP